MLRIQSARNGILVHRLKNRTQVFPTAELSLQGAYGQLIGGQDQGVKIVSSVLDITRVHYAVVSVGYMRKVLSLATSYTSLRRAGPERILLRDIPLHLSEVECQTADESARHRLRVLTTALKAFCAEKGVQATIE